MSDFGKVGQALFDPGDFSGIGSQGEIGDIYSRSSRDTLSEMRRQFDLQNQRLDPFYQQSAPAINILAQLAGVQGGDAQAGALAGLGNEPGMQFRNQELERAALRNAAASGGLGGGNILSQLQSMGIQNRQQQLMDQFNRLSPIAGIADTTGQQLGRLGQQFSNQTSQQLQQSAQAQAAGIAGQQQATSNLLSTGLGIFGAIASDKNLKTDIRDVSHKECFDIVMNTDIKAWKYIDELGIDGEHIGPMSQEAHDSIKIEGREALNLHDELWLIAGAMKHFFEVTKNG